MVHSVGIAYSIQAVQCPSLRLFCRCAPGAATAAGAASNDWLRGVKLASLAQWGSDNVRSAGFMAAFVVE
jgi:hypothetical protein